jgi:lysophospholipase L1-like esterase
VAPRTLCAQGGDAPALVTIFLGANDAALPGRMSARQHVPLEQYAANLRRVAAHVTQTYSGGLGGAASGSGAPARAPPALVFITPPPVDEAARVVAGVVRWGAEFDGQAERTNAVARQYADACKAVAAELGAPCVDAWSALQALPNWQALLDDGLHFAPSGNEALFNALVQVIDAQLPHLAPEAIPFDFVEWWQVDAEDPVRAPAWHDGGSVSEGCALTRSWRVAARRRSSWARAERRRAALLHTRTLAARAPRRPPYIIASCANDTTRSPRQQSTRPFPPSLRARSRASHLPRAAAARAPAPPPTSNASSPWRRRRRRRAWCRT